MTPAPLDPQTLDRARAALGRGPVALVAGRGGGRSAALAQVADGLGGEVLRVTGRVGFDDRPLAALGATADIAPGRLVEQLVAARSVLVVDDPHLLTPTDLAVLDAASDGGARLLLTHTDEATQPAGVDALLAGASRVTVPPLDPAGVRSFVAARLGAAPDAAGLAELGTVTQGRPGLLARLLDAAPRRTEGDLVVLPGPLGALPGAVRWRRERVRDAALHRLLRLAVRRPRSSRADLAAVVGADLVERALDDGLVVVDGVDLAVPDPLLRATLATVDVPTHRREDATALLAEHRERTPAVIVRRWRAEAGEELSADERAALVLTLLEEGEPLTALAHAQGPSSAPPLVIARAAALAAAARPEEAVVELEQLLDQDDPSLGARSRGEAALLLADLLFFRTGDVPGAAAALARVPADAGGLHREAAGLGSLLVAALGGGTGDLLPIEERGSLPPVARGTADLFAVLAGATRGPDGIAVPPPGVGPPGLPLHTRGRTNQRLAVLYEGGVDAARPVVEQEVALAVATGRPGAIGLALGSRGEVEQLEGRVVDAERTLRAAVLRAEFDDDGGILEVVRAARATALAELGRLEQAAATLPGGLRATSADLRVRLFGSGARSRVLAAETAEAAAAAARDDVEVALATGHVVWGVLAALHAARAGLGVAVAAPVAAVRPRLSGLTAAAADAVLALADGDRVACRTAADACADRGMRRVAAELVLARPPVPERDRRFAAALLDGLGPPRPDAATARAPLTDRERQVATLAAAGRTSRDIAERLGISVRTVDNHLRRSYGKLGVAGRDELAVLLASPG
jgi:DNA-binding CsgD family transcriptional regulator